MPAARHERQHADRRDVLASPAWPRARHEAQGRLRHRLLRGRAACALFVDHHSARAHRRWPSWCKRYPIKSGNVIAHIRKATQGQVALENTHPFMRELWGTLLGVRAQRRPEGLSSAAARRVSSCAATRRQRTCTVLADARSRPRRTPAVPSIDELTRTLAELLAAAGVRTARSTCCCPTARRCGRTARRDCTGCSAGTRSRHARLADEDLSVDFATRAAPARPRGHRRHRAADRRRSLAVHGAGRAARLRAGLTCLMKPRPRSLTEG